jgi:hypothetical protein
MEAAAPIPNTVARIAAAVGRETGRVAEVGEEKRSIIRPIVKGIERDMEEETTNKPTAAPIMRDSGRASWTSRLTSPIWIFSRRGLLSLVEEVSATAVDCDSVA